MKQRNKRPPHRPPKFTPAQVIAALEASAGIRIGAARMLHCSRSTITYYIERYKEIADALDEIMENRLDIAEGVIITRMGDKTNPAVQANCAQFYLKLKGGERGFCGAQRTLKLSMPAVESAADVPSAMAEVFDRVTAGDITLEQGRQLTELLELRRRALVEVDIEARLANVERAALSGTAAKH